MWTLEEKTIRPPSGLQWGFPRMESFPWRTKTRASPLARSRIHRHWDPSASERKATRFPSGDTSAWDSVWALLRTRRRPPPGGGGRWGGPPRRRRGTPPAPGRGRPPGAASARSVPLRHGRAQGALGPRDEGGLDEAVQVPVQPPRHVPHLEFRPVVLDHLVRVHDVGADLAAEGDVLLGRRHRVQLGPLLLPLQIVEAGLQHLQGHVAVADLAALVLAGDDDAGGQVGDAHRGVGHVHMLAPRPARAVGVDADVLLLNLDLDVLVDLRPDEDGGEGGVAAGPRIEGADPHQSVPAPTR